MQPRLDFTAVNKFFNNPLPVPPPKSSAPPSAKFLQEKSNLLNIWSTLPNVPVYHNSQIPTPPQSPKFNPNAPSFTPTHHKSGSVPSVSHAHSPRQHPGRPTWASAFLAGTNAVSSNEHAVHAKTLVAN